MFRPQLHLCGLVQHATLEISYDKMMICFFCFACNITSPCVLDVNVKGQTVPNKGNLSHVHVTEKTNWIQHLTSLDETTFLSMHLENKLIVVHLLKAI
jgi:hypothetical protein